MFAKTALALFALTAVASAAPAPAPSQAASPFICMVVAPGPPVKAIAPGSPINGWELADHDGHAVLVNDGTGMNTRISYTDGGMGFFASCHTLWLNQGTNAKSFKPLTFDQDKPVTKNWNVGQNKIVTQKPNTQTFLACEENGEYRLYLQTGNDEPAGSTCYKAKLQVQPFNGQ